MKSTSGDHFLGLDHLRALAAFLVVLWHFAHYQNGPPVPTGHAPEISLIDEGHSGVALFMCLSGYLFAKLIGWRRISYRAFLLNRILRLAPMLVVALLLGFILKHHIHPGEYLSRIVAGLFFSPAMPQGGWSILTEMHFYLLLPALLWLARRWQSSLLAVVGVAILARFGLWAAGYNIQFFAYGSLLGRIDHFALGILFALRRPGRGAPVFLALLWIVYAWFSSVGGFNSTGNEYVWIFLPTIEALGFGWLIAWYDRHPLKGKWLRPIEKAGERSYSIYLLHIPVVGMVSSFVDTQIMPLSSIYVAIPCALLFFVVISGASKYTYEHVELRFLKYRKPYLLPEDKSDTLEQPFLRIEPPVQPRTALTR